MSVSKTLEAFNSQTNDMLKRQLDYSNNFHRIISCDTFSLKYSESSNDITT